MGSLYDSVQNLNAGNVSSFKTSGAFTISGGGSGATAGGGHYVSGDPLFSALAGSSSTSSTVLGPERLTARTDLAAAGEALGRPLPAVIGTGRVDGVYFIGGVVTSDTRTTLTTTTIKPPEGSVISVANDANEAQNIAFLESLFTQRTIDTETSITSSVVTKAGYILAYDYYERGYDLIRLEVDGKVVFDTENFIAPTVEFRFYGGQQTEPDPIVSDIVGALAGAYQNMVMVFIDGFPSESPPSISAVISNAATDQPEDVRIDWTGDPPPSLYQISAGRNTAYDPGRGTMYAVFTDLEGASGEMKLAVLDIATHTELYRVSLEGTDATYSAFAYSIRGTDYVMVRTAEPSQPRIDGIYSVLTGKLIASYNEGSESAATIAADPTVNNFSWHMGESFQGKWLMIGNNLAGNTDEYELVVGVFDYANAAITITRGLQSGSPPVSPGEGSFCYGRVSDSSASFFWVSDASAALFPDVREVIFNGTDWSIRDVYEHNVIVESIWYDTGTGYLILSTFTTTALTQPCLQYIDPEDGSVIHTVLSDSFFSIPQDESATGQERFWPRTGNVLYKVGGALASGSIYSLDVAQNQASLWADMTGYSEIFTGIFDQVHGYYITGYNDTNWTIHYLPNQLPGLVDLQDIVTDIMYLAGFTSSDLTFSGFGGLSSYGFVISADTNIQTAVRVVADIYDFYWCDTGSGFYVKKPATDLSLTIDATFTLDDICERSDPVMSSDEGDIRTPSSVELEYISKEGGYKARPASFSMTTGVLNSITTPRLSTPILFNDAEAQRLVTEKFFQFQENRRGHAFCVVPENITLLPGDVVSVPSGEVSYIAVINSIGIDLRNMDVEITANDFATEVATTITAVSNDAGTPVLVRFTSIYIHLDIPLLQFSHDTNGTSLTQYGLVAARLSTWTGGAVYRGATVTTMSLLFDQPAPSALVAITQDALGAPFDPFATTDTSTVTIRPVVGDVTLLVDVTEDDVLDNNKNLAIIGNNGRWELVGYTTVTDNGDGSYELSGFVRRGYHGSEVWADNHTAGDYFILVDLLKIKHAQHAITDLDDTFFYKAVGFGENPLTVAAFPHTIPGVAETPYAPRNLDASISTGGGLDLSWDYRSRVADGLNPADHGEATLAFEIDIRIPGNSPEVVRTLTSTTNFVHYSSADVTTDFGSDPPDEIFFDVFMMSALPILVPGQTKVGAGRGYKASRHEIFTTPSFTFDSEIIKFDSEDITWDAE